MKRYANWRVDRRGPGYLVIRDVGPHDLHPTVTNDADDVVLRLFAEGKLKEGDRLFYYDSEGEPGELVLNELAFSSFSYWDGSLP